MQPMSAAGPRVSKASSWVLRGPCPADEKCVSVGLRNPAGQINIQLKPEDPSVSQGPGRCGETAERLLRSQGTHSELDGNVVLPLVFGQSKTVK